MKIAVIGSRTFNDYELLSRTLDQYKITMIISGGAKGADTLGANYAKEHNIELVEYYPEYEKYGKKKAPFIRNRTIVDDSEIVIAFWDMGSTGTKHAITYATSKKKKVIIINYLSKLEEKVCLDC